MFFIDPVALHLGPLPIRWYGLMYFVGILGVWRYSLSLLNYYPEFSKKNLEDFIVWSVIGIIVGGRLGHILLYNPGYYSRHWLEIFQTWKGGMSFHGGLIGMGIVLGLYCFFHRLSFWRFTDLISCGVPIGLFFGRLGNFINQELYGRLTTVPWAVSFPQAGGLPRHPSQLYEAGLEGLGLFLLLRLCLVKGKLYQRPGCLTGLFLLNYGITRWFVEYFREPEGQVEFLNIVLTIGQYYSLPLILGGLFIFYLKIK